MVGGAPRSLPRAPPRELKCRVRPDLSRPSDELGNPANAYEEITSYNNYYEFSTNKEAVAPLSKGFTTSPWTLEVTRMVLASPNTFGIEDLLDVPQEKTASTACAARGSAGAWSFRGNGLSAGKLLKAVEPTLDAKYVRF